MAFLDLKIFNNLKNSGDSKFGGHHAHLMKRRLEADLLELAEKTLKGRVTHCCIEVSDQELPLMLEVLSNPTVQSRLQFQQQEIPTQFLIGFRNLTVF